MRDADRRCCIIAGVRTLDRNNCPEVTEFTYPYVVAMHDLPKWCPSVAFVVCKPVSNDPYLVDVKALVVQHGHKAVILV
jgi:hypothetical protein